jgi:hypothetical protein
VNRPMSRVVTLLLLGYLCMGRSFAYWGIPPWHLFIGEVVLALFLLAGPFTSGGRWPWAVWQNPVLGRFGKVLLLFLVCGVFQVIRGIYLGHPLLNTARDLAFNYYPFYFFLGLWVGLQNREFLPKLLRAAGWVNGLYGLLFVLALSRIPLLFPGVSAEVEPVSIFGQPSFSGPILLGLLSFEKDMRRIWPLLLLNTAVLLGMLIRAEWVAFAVGLAVWAWATGKVKQAALCASLVFLLLGVMYVTNFSYEGPETRGRTISAKDVIGQVIAPFNPALAANYTSDLFNAELSEGTTIFRALYWTGVWTSVHRGLSSALLGHGYGFPLGEVVPLLHLDVRTPHNLFFYALGYSGWLGVAVFALFLAELLRLVLKVYRQTGQPYGLVLWVSIITFAVFTPFFETPQGAIPFYLLTGCLCAALFYEQQPVSTIVRFEIPNCSDSRIRSAPYSRPAEI